MKKFGIALLFLTTQLFSQQELPNISLLNGAGKSVSLKSDFSEKDKIYIFSFWATWCSPCISELDEMNELLPSWQNQLNLEIIAVATDDSRTVKRVKPLVNGKDWLYSILLDTNQDFKRAMSIVNIPYTIVVKNSKIVHIQNGYVPGGESVLFQKLKSL